jgi:two-component system invasion response regulator UvrY
MNVAIVEDHRIIAEALQRTLKNHPGIKEVKLFLSGDEFLETVDNWKPQLIISDLLMPGTHGVDVIRAYRARFGKNLKIIILSSVTSKPTVQLALKQNIDAYLSKSASLDEFITAVNKVLAGDQYVSSALKRKLSNNLIEEEFSYHLSPREKDVLRLVCSGRIIKEVAEDLGLSTHTVQSYHKNILQKFNVKRTTDLVRIAIQLGFYNPDDN